MKQLKLQTVMMLMVVSAAAILVAVGCGKKGPPLPPIEQADNIASPYDLKYTVSVDQLTLTWNHRADPENAAVKPDSFEVFMARKTFEACEGCPFVFKTLQVVAMPEMSCTVTLEKGYRYYFRIQAVNEDNIRSEYSKTVQYENR